MSRIPTNERDFWAIRQLAAGILRGENPTIVATSSAEAETLFEAAKALAESMETSREGASRNVGE